MTLIYNMAAHAGFIYYINIGRMKGSIVQMDDTIEPHLNILKHINVMNEL
jgi:hypothetical protein